MFNKIKHAFSLNDVSAHRTQGERQQHELGRNIVGIGNPYNVTATSYTVPSSYLEQNHLAQGSQSREFTSALAGCSNPTAPIPSAPPSNLFPMAQQHAPLGTLMFTSLMQSTDLQRAQQSAFFTMDVPVLLKEAGSLLEHPDRQEFKIILFNDSFRVCPGIKLHDRLKDEIRTALFTSTKLSYQLLANMAISLSQNTAATYTLRQNGVIGSREFDEMHHQLRRHSGELSQFGEQYYEYVCAKPREDMNVYYLAVEPLSDKQGKYKKLYKAAVALDKNIKRLMNRHPKETRAVIDYNLNTIVSHFIYNYYRLQAPANVPIQLTHYIHDDKLDEIQALFKNNVRDNAVEMQVNMGGTQHSYECYSEIFSQLKSREEIALLQRR